MSKPTVTARKVIAERDGHKHFEMTDMTYTVERKVIADGAKGVLALARHDGVTFP